MSDYQKVLGDLANLQRQLGNLMRPVTVEEVKEGRIRPKIGKDNNGKDVLGPWIHPGDMRGGDRVGKDYKKGQNLMMISPGGDVAQAFVVPWAPNNEHKRPDHASEDGKDEETYQKEDLRTKKTKNGWVNFLQPPEQDQQQNQQQQAPSGSAGGDGDATPAKKHKKQTPDGKMQVRMHKDDGVELRIKEGGKTLRCIVTKTYVKMKVGTDYAMVKDGELSCSREWVIKPDTTTDKNDTDV